jgi:DICT domain-containing protein
MDFSVLDETLAQLRANGQVTEATAQDPIGVSTGATTRITGRPSSLLRWCKATETAVIDRAMDDAQVFVGFQAFSRSRLVADRFRRIQRVCASLYVVGKPDAELDFPVTVAVPIESGPMLGEWFLLVVASVYQGLLVAREQAAPGAGVPGGTRTLSGVITHDAPTIRALAERMTSAFERAAG